MGRLDGKVAIVTGAARGIGRAAAELFAAEGARLVLVDRDEEPLRETAASVGPAAFAVPADVTDPDETEAYVREAVDRFGGVDVLLANAGIEGVVRPIPDYPIEVFDRVIAVNVRGVWLGLRAVMPVMERRGGGSIVITSSIAGLKGGAPGVSAYVTSKHAVIGMMRTAALEGAPHGIRVNTVNPSPAETRMMRSLEEGLAPGAAADAKRSLSATIPAGRYATPEEVARLMLFLAGDESRFCTGAVYSVDGGMCAT